MIDATTTIEDTSFRAAETTALCRQFLSVAAKKLTGTLIVRSESGETACFLVQNGTLSDIDTGREQTLLTEILLAVPNLSPKLVKKAQRHAERTGSSVGTALVELQAIPEDELLRAIEEGIASEVTEVFGWSLRESVFHPHRADERIEGFVSDLSDLFDLLADPETLFLEAAQRLGRWDLVRACYDLLRDVFYATPGTFGYFREPETYPAEIRILASIDGVKDVEEVIAESGLEPFTAIDVVRQLIRDNAIELINPVQLFQLGTQSDADGSLDKACRLFRRAMERGLDDFDVELRLAQCLERLGRRSEAAECFLSFSRRCLGQLRVDDAIRSLERVAKLDPANAGAVEQLVDLFLQHNRFDQALEAAMAYAHRIGTETQKALQILLKLRSANLRDVRVHEKIIELATELGDQELVREERELIAQAFYDRRDAADALEAYQRMFCEGQDTLEIRLKLIQLHKENGNRQKAIEHINYLLNLGGRRRVSDVEQLLFLHNTMRELQPADTRSNRFLADYYLSQGQKEQALEIVRAWIPELEKTADLPDLASALEWVITLDDQISWRWSLAQVLERQGKLEHARTEFQKLAHRAMHQREFDEAARALEHLLRRSPLDVETRRMEAELCEMRDQKELAADRIKELALLEIIAGNIQEAEGYCRQYLLSRPDDAEIIDKFARLCLEEGDHRKAVEQLLKAAKIHLDSHNLGLARNVLERLLKLEPQHVEAESLLARVSDHESAISRGAMASAPAAASDAGMARGHEGTATTSTAQASTPRAVNVKASVSGITARLRDMKSSTTRSRTRTVPAIADIAARLRSTTSGSAGAGSGASTSKAEGLGAIENVSTSPRVEASEPPATPELHETAARPSSAAGLGAESRPISQDDLPTPQASGALKSAAARLKALSSKQRPSALTTAGASASDAEPIASSPSQGALDATAPAAAAATPGSSSAPESSLPQAPSDAAAANGDAPGQSPPTARISAKLGASASKLALLRKSTT